ncbi:MAG: flap endonuclease-1 [Candidatus Anstonellales archaeon]
MGVNISPLLDEIRHEREIYYFSKKTIAFDAYNTIYQFLASIRQPDGTPLMDLKGNVTSHLSGLFYRTIKIISAGIKPIYVFDGKPPKFKLAIVERERAKMQAKALLEKAKEYEEQEQELLYAKESLKLTKDMVKESIDLLTALGVYCITAPSEGEAQAAYMTKTGKVDYSASQDYDSLLFGSIALVRNLSISERRKMPRRDEYITVKPEEIILEEVLNKLGINRGQLILIGMLVGSDFNEGIKGIGPKTALKIVKEYKTKEKAFNYIKEHYGKEIENAEEIYEFFNNPPVRDFEIKDIEMNENKIYSLLVDEHDFSEERIKNALQELKEAKEKERQRSIKEWFK